MSDSEDDMPGLGRDTQAATKAEPVEPEVKKDDVVVEDTTRANEPIQVLKSALKKKKKKAAEKKAKVAARVDDPSTAPSAGTLSIIRKLQTGMRQQSKRAVQQQKKVAATPAAEPSEEEPVREPSSYLGVSDDKDGFVSGWDKVVDDFVSDPARQSYECPLGLSGYDRKMLHQLAEQFNLGHKSRGFGPDRRLVLTKDRLFYDLGGLRPAQERLDELKGWTDMTKRFTPASSRITAETVSKIEGLKEYSPGGTAAVVEKATREKRAREDYRMRVSRLAKLREMNKLGIFSEKEDLSSYADLAPSAKRRRQAAPMAPPPAPASPAASSTPAPSIAPSEDPDFDDVGKAMRDFLTSGLAPKQIAVVRGRHDDGTVEPLGLRFTKDLLITGVSGVAEDSGMPVDMFITEVDGVDVVTPGEFTNAIKEKTAFSLTLWYLRKDGFTVEKLKDVAARAETALAKAVEGDEDEGGLPTCTVCESTRPLLDDEKEWDGVKKLFCSNCNVETDWVLEALDASSDEEEEEEQVRF
ncbi:hypothetical protein DIPPA_10508 [Diplonema papillatum]|nr:hypothetical protein DIPPA_10508 [Diplonema papillatum]KAJ9464397.1 hypothetical protein DIPPA_10508 [Diplonema papillatum]